MGRSSGGSDPEEPEHWVLTRRDVYRCRKSPEYCSWHWYCSLPNSGRSGQEQPTVRTTSDWSRGRIRPDGWLSCICSAQLFLSGSAKIGETAIIILSNSVFCGNSTVFT